MALFQSTWRGNNWSVPKDVLVSPDGANIFPNRVILDNNDYVHIFWGGEGGRRIWHYSAHATQLENPNGWSQHDSIITEDIPFTFDITSAGQGIWHLAYGNRDLNKIIYRSSADNGDTWVTEQTVHLEISPDIWAGYPGIMIAPDGALWLWWRQMEEGTGRSTGLQYSTLKEPGENWRPPEQYADGYFSGGFSVQDDLMIRAVGGGIGTGGRFVSFSSDNGATWTAPENISAGAGEGAQAIPRVVDSEGNLHFVVETNSAFAQVEWNGRYWGEPDFVVSRDQMVECCITPGKVTENANAAISNGNLMHVFFEEADTIIWYANRRLAVPETEASEIPALPEISKNEAQLNISADEKPSENVDPSTPVSGYDFSGQAEPEDGAVLPVLLPIAAVSILLIAVFIWLNPRRSSR
jgi:hypothetical protein